MTHWSFAVHIGDYYENSELDDVMHVQNVFNL